MAACHGGAGHLTFDGQRFAIADETAFVFGPGFPVVTERLASGARIADLASGNGDVVLMLARAFSSAEITGYELDPALTEGTLARAAEANLANVRAMAVSADELPEDAGYDLVTCLDSFHHFGDPAAVARSVRRGLGDGGVFLVAESATSGDLAEDAQSPFSLITYGAGLIYCLQENLANGGSGLAGGDGPCWVLAALEAGGFTDVGRTTPRPATASSSRRRRVVSSASWRRRR
jgi:SAM-dependent methyltransferase